MRVLILTRARGRQVGDGTRLAHALEKLTRHPASMVQIAKDLAQRGEIMLADGGRDDELIY